ncbi:MAG: plasmid mobilization protein [Terriglobales bacterium]
MVKPSLRTKSIGFKVTEEEYSQLETSAQMSGRTVGEWCREVVLASANGQPPKAGPGTAEAQALMAELLALRAILLNVLFKLANGEKPTAEDMQRLIDRADSDKLKKAQERLAQAAGPEGPEKQP